MIFKIVSFLGRWLTDSEKQILNYRWNVKSEDKSKEIAARIKKEAEEEMRKFLLCKSPVYLDELATRDLARPAALNHLEPPPLNREEFFK